MGTKTKEAIVDIGSVVLFSFLCGWMLTTALHPLYPYDWWRVGCLFLGLRMGYNALIRG